MGKTTNVSPLEREIFIIDRAAEEGFIFDRSEAFSIIVDGAIEYLLDNGYEDREVDIKLEMVGRDQRIDWEDGMGYAYWQQGEIVDFGKSGRKLVAKVVDSLARVVCLYVNIPE